MRVRDLVTETYSALDANRARSALTILGIVIGIGAVIAMTTLIGGINESLAGELGMSQARRINIGLYLNQTITDDDVARIAKELPDYEYMTGTSWGSAQATTGEKSADANLTGCKPVYFQATGTKFAQGRAFTDSEESSGSQVLIIDKNSVRVLFGSAEAQVVGKTVRLGNDVYTVIGVTEDSESFGAGDTVNGYVPLNTMGTRITGTREIGSILGFAREGVDIDTLVKETEDFLAKTYNIAEEDREDSFYVYSMKEYIEQANSMMASFSILMTSVAGISLLVGGIGIMNMMLTNVTERIREIGLRKALGARRSDITKQFMLESVALCLIGGFLGVVLGFLGAFGLAGFAGSALLGGEMELRPVIDVQTVVIATVVCTVIGVLFGWYPARRAARLDPVESLHYQ